MKLVYYFDVNGRMEELKRVDELTEPDPRNLMWEAWDPEDFGRRLRVSDQHAEMQALELPESVPDPVRSAFAVTRTLWLYGWYYWPFYTLAQFHAYATLEMGLHLRCEMESVYEELGLKRKNAGLKRLLQEALERRWLVDEDFQRFRFWRERARWDGEDDYVWPKPKELDEDIPSDQHYGYLVRETSSFFRNERAHPKHYSHADFGSSQQVLQAAYDMLTAIFPSDVSG